MAKLIDWDDVKSIKTTFRKGTAVQWNGSSRYNIIGPGNLVAESILPGQNGTVRGLKSSVEGGIGFTDVTVEWSTGTTTTHPVRNLAVV